MDQENTSSHIIYTLIVIFIVITLANLSYSFFFIDFSNPGLRLFYHANELEEFFLGLRDDQRDPFLFLLLLDYLFLAISAIFYSNFIRYSYWKLLKVEEIISRIALVPYLYAALDFLENTLFVLLTVTPGSRLPLEVLTSIVSVGKWVALGISLVLCFLGLIIWFLHRLSRKIVEKP